MARPTFEDTKKFERMIIPRDSKEYTRIEKYTKASFLNNIIFEFFLRDSEFKKVYQELNKDVQDLIGDRQSPYNREMLELDDLSLSDMLLTKFDNIVEKYSEDFLKFNYSSYDMASYLYNIYITRKRLDEMERRFSRSSSPKSLPKKEILTLKQDLSKTQEPSGLNEYDEIPNIVEYRYDYPTYNASTNNINIKVNLNLPQEVILEQIRVLLQSLQTQNPNTHDIRDLIGKKDIYITFANYFYVYDHTQMGIPNTMIKEQIDKLQNKSSISVNTIKEHMIKMTDLFRDRKFTQLTFI